MNPKELIEKYAEVEKRINILSESLKPFLKEQSDIKELIMGEMNKQGIKRIEHEELGLQVIYATRKSEGVSNDVQAIAILESNNIKPSLYMNPDKKKVVAILKDLKIQGISIDCIESKETSYLTFKKK